MENLSSAREENAFLTSVWSKVSFAQILFRVSGIFTLTCFFQCSDFSLNSEINVSFSQQSLEEAF